MEHVIYPIKTYRQATAKFIINNGVSFDTVEDVSEELVNNNRGYHFRISKDKTYIFFGDIDNYGDTFDVFVHLLIVFMNTCYSLHLDVEDIKYTKNNAKNGSYHFSIPCFNLSIKKMKEIMSNMINFYPGDFSYNKDGKTVNCIDTSVYSDHWYRCPYQTKGDGDKSEHIIVNGNIEDFVVSYIPEASKNIEDCKYDGNDDQNLNQNFNQNLNQNQNLNFNQNPNQNFNQNPNQNFNQNHNQNFNKNYNQNFNQNHPNQFEMPFCNLLNNFEFHKKIIDECFNQNRFDVYGDWITYGMAIKNTMKDPNEAFELFDYFSRKSNKYGGREKTLKVFKDLNKNQDNAKSFLTVRTIFKFAVDDNKNKFSEIMNKNLFALGDSDICKIIKSIAGHRFVYKRNDGVYTLYSFTGTYWETDDVIFKKFISNELYELIQLMIKELYWNSNNFKSLKTQLEKIKNINTQNNIVESYKQEGLDDEVKFDDKWWLLGFKDKVLDLNEGCIRDYRYDDYVSITTGYNWREPTQEELNTVNGLISKIMPIPEERKLYLQILCSALNGKCLEKFIVFNGKGGNGKGLMNDLLLKFLGDYGMIGNNSLLFEASKTGSNPEKANIHKKRLVILREPDENQKIKNSVMRELTGGGYISARGHHESNTKKELNLTLILEANHKPLLSDTPKKADIRRLIDLPFPSVFTDKPKEVNPEKHIYLANSVFKTPEFQEKHKFALGQILIDSHHEYAADEFVFDIPDSIEERTWQYLALSSDIYQWFIDNYTKTHDKKDVYKLKDIYDEYKQSEDYGNLTKFEKKKYTEKHFKEYFAQCPFLEEFVSGDKFLGWKLKEKNKNNDDKEENHDSDSDNNNSDE